MKNLFLLVLLLFSVVVTAQTNTQNYQKYDDLMHCSSMDTMQMSSSHSDLNCCNTCFSNVIFDNNISFVAYVIINLVIVTNKITNQYTSLIQEIITPPPTA
jgi:hypothetical protein